MTETPVARADAPALRLTAELVRAHQVAVWRYLRVLGCPAEDASDLVQETFLALLHGHLADHGAAATRAWLRGTARNLFFAHCRRTRRAPVHADPQAVEAAFLAYESDDDGEGYRRALRDCLGALPVRQRRLLDLQVRDRATPEALGAAAGLAPEGARSLLRRVKQALRACVQRRLHGDE